MSREYEAELVTGVNPRILLDERDQRIEEPEAQLQRVVPREHYWVRDERHGVVVCLDCGAVYDWSPPSVCESQTKLQQRIQELEGKNAELCRDLKDAYYVLNSSLEHIASEADALRIAAARVVGTSKDILWECRQVKKRIEELEGGKDE